MIPPLLLANAARTKMYCVYLLRNLKTSKGYIGWTTDIERRLCQHNNGESTATKNRGPYELIYYEAYRHKDAPPLLFTSPDNVGANPTFGRDPAGLPEMQKEVVGHLGQKRWWGDARGES